MPAVQRLSPRFVNSRAQWKSAAKRVAHSGNGMWGTQAGIFAPNYTTFELSHGLLSNFSAQGERTMKTMNFRRDNLRRVAMRALLAGAFGLALFGGMSPGSASHAMQPGSSNAAPINDFNAIFDGATQYRVWSLNANNDWYVVVDWTEDYYYAKGVYDYMRKQGCTMHWERSN
jgi:hypothetical protein